MTKEEMKALSRRFYETWEANDLEGMRAIFAPDFVSHQTGAPGPLNRKQLFDIVATFNAAFTDQHYTIEDQIVEGDRVVTRSQWRGTHSAVFMGLPATGRQVEITGIMIDRIQDGKIVERWLNHDTMGLMQQLGVVPPPQTAR